MKKLRLEIEQLEVESFATATGPEDGLGTVRGLADKTETQFPQETCPMEYTPFVMSCDPADCVSMEVDCTMSLYTTDLNDACTGG
ncbi:MAG TPA: hypothetical protein VF746_21295 [Longimicrobium sp.]|jgi:hypothetical protein